MRPLRFAGHALAIVWAGFWIAAGAWSGWAESCAAGALRYAVVPGGLFALIAAAVWRWERVGSWAILLCGLAILWNAARQPDTTGQMLLLAGPPLAGGLMLILYHRLESAARRSGPWNASF